MLAADCPTNPVLTSTCWNAPTAVYYVGSAGLGLDRRISEHNSGTYGSYTSKRRPRSHPRRLRCGTSAGEEAWV